jgi:phosphoheptose isomerase
MTNVLRLFDNYKLGIGLALQTIDRNQIDYAYSLLQNTIRMHNKRRVFVCGNGGSAAVAEHWSCDHSKGVRTDTDVMPQVISLSSNMPLLTAIANDIGYSEVFVEQMKYHNVTMDDVLVVISSSGESANIIKAYVYAQQKRIDTIALVGFSGGTIKTLYEAHTKDKMLVHDALIHVRTSNYGMIEDCHQIIMHVLAQSLRKDNLVGEVTVPF